MFQMILESIKFAFSIITDDRLQVAGMTVVGICFLNFLVYTVFRFLIEPLFGGGIGWSSMRFNSKSDSVSDSNNALKTSSFNGYGYDSSTINSKYGK